MESPRHLASREPACLPHEKAANDLSPATAPVLAQIPAGAPGRGYWGVIGTLVWLASFSLLLSLYARWTGEFLGSLGEAGPIHLVFLIGLLIAPLPLLLHNALRRRWMERLGAPARMEKRRGGWVVSSEQPLPRRPALLCLIGPPALLTVLGLGGMALHWPWMAVLISLEWAVSAADLSLALRVLREPGCTGLQFRPDGVVLFGTSRTPARTAPARVWLRALIVVAGWLLVVPFLFFGPWAHRLPDLGDAWPVLLMLLAISALVATFHVSRLRRQEVKEQHRRREREADEARRMQRSLLPAAPAAASGLQVAASFQAAHEVSGDFYLFLPAPPGVLRLVVGDVAGKGVPAALTAALAVGVLRGSAAAAADPATLLRSTSASLRSARSGRTMVATCAAELSTDTGCLRWCNAGLPPPALHRDGEVSWLTGGGVPLGSLAQAVYQGQAESLRPGDLLLFYTDGLVEATSPLGDQFGRERLGGALGRLPPACTAAEALAALQHEVARFTGETEPYDDITAVALRLGIPPQAVPPPPPRRD